VSAASPAGTVSAASPAGTVSAASPAGTVIRFDAVSKWFKGVVAVSDVSFTIGTGVTALLGPNGAGKSTILRMICGLAEPSLGTVSIYGRDPRHDRTVRGHLGLIPQQEKTFPRMRALDFVRLAATLSGVDSPDAAARASLGVVELDAEDRRPVDQYSKGMRQRVKVAQSLVGGASVIVADEPLNGLDPRQRRSMIDLFARLGSEGRCVIISSHVLDEVERFGSNVLVVAQGRLAATGDFHQIRNLMDDRPHRVRVRTGRARKVAAGLISSGSAVGVHLVDEYTIELEAHDISLLGRTIAPLARLMDAVVTEVTPLDDDLESVFRYLVGAPGPGGVS